ncbi:hypothetical protein [Vibrio anguillarum]|nr:hypothetical protein [Vibrio anguillarum]
MSFNNYENWESDQGLSPEEFAASLVELNNEHFDGRLPEQIGQ